MMWGYGMGWGYWLGMSLTMVLFLGLIVLGIVVLIRYAGGPRDGSAQRGGPTGPENLLAERFARGEIDEDEFQRRLELLHAAAGSSTGK